MKALRNLRSLFKNRRNKTKEAAKITGQSPHVREAKTTLKRKKGKRDYALKPNGWRKGHDPFAQGGCRVPGGKSIDWEEHRYHMDQRMRRKSAKKDFLNRETGVGNIKYARLRLTAIKKDGVTRYI